MSKEIQKIENNSSEAPLPTPKEGETEEIKNNNFTICPDCGSTIEILSINENISSIKYKCLNENNKHVETEFTIEISVYLKNIKELKENKIDELKDRCHKDNHNLNKYVSYCLDCKCHLCDECLKTREHINHRKSNMIEIQPREEELKLINEVINDYKNEKKKLENIKNKQIEEIKKSFAKEKKKIEDNCEEKCNTNKDEKEEKLKINKNKYLSDIEDIKKEYEKQLKLRKNKYLEDNEKIINEYKLKDEKFLSEKNLKIKQLEDNCKSKIENLKFEIKIENNENMLELNEIIYNTYGNYSNNYYNSMSINNLLLYYNNNRDINEKMRNTLGNRYDQIINIRKTKFNEDIQIKLEDELKKVNKKNTDLKEKLSKLEEKIKSEEKEQNINEINENNEEFNNLEERLNKIINKLKTDLQNMKDKNKTLEEEKTKKNEDFEKIQKLNNELNEKLNNIPKQNVILFLIIFQL